MFTDTDITLLNQKGISQERVLEQLSRFKEGFPYLKLFSSASTDIGIYVLNENEIETYRQAWLNYLRTGAETAKFVPASGAASRMFKDLFAYLESPEHAEMPAVIASFFESIDQFAFYKLLDDCCEEHFQGGVAYLIRHNRHRDIIKALLLPEYMAYGSLPKALLQFHHYGNLSRTPIEEHMVEGALYAKCQNNRVNLHFTVSPEHMAYVQELVEQKRACYEQKFSVEYHITYSIQKPSTDTIAVDLDNNPYRENGKLVFRPGGHGALIENLNEIDKDVVFIKNIDNVVPDLLKAPTILYKEVLGGVLVSFQKQIFALLEELKGEYVSRERLHEILFFLENRLWVTNDEAYDYDNRRLIKYLISKLHRPLRVCGVVKNTGEPGGGPFYVYSEDGSIAGQILESSQINMQNSIDKEIFESSTHFNPVDLVCGLRDHQGRKFDLPEYVDPQTGFIAEKSKNGVTVKALELPGLWNGAMSDWNTLFVEVPIETFNPVKSVIDLLRPEHQ